MNDDELRQAIADAVANAIPNKDEILAAITEGVRKAFDQVYASEILGAIADGSKEALRDQKQ